MSDKAGEVLVLEKEALQKEAALAQINESRDRYNEALDQENEAFDRWNEALDRRDEALQQPRGEALQQPSEEALQQPWEEAQDQPSENPPSSPYDWWNFTANGILEAQILAIEMNLDFPGATAIEDERCISIPLRRLIVTGSDTQANFLAFFGPQWPSDTSFYSIFNDIRMDVLLSTPWSHPVSGHAHISMRLDFATPRYAPRSATALELENVGRILTINWMLTQRRQRARRRRVIQDDINAVMACLPSECYEHNLWALHVAMRHRTYEV